MKIIETGPREIGFVLWGHCQNLLDDPRIPYLFLSKGENLQILTNLINSNWISKLVSRE